MNRVFRRNLIGNLILAGFLICSVPHVVGQQIKKENRQGRLEYEYNMYKNPSTGKVPANIRKKELLYKNSRRTSTTKVGSESWAVRGPYNQAGRTKAFGIDTRNTNVRLTGGASGGMFRTTDGGANWTKVSNSLDNPSITGVAQDPTSQDTWYYITGEAKESVHTNQSNQIYTGGGVFKSTDNGVTWASLSSTTPESAILGSGIRSDWQICNDIAMDPIDGAILVGNIGGIYRSADGGVSWSEVLDAHGLVNYGDVIHLDVVKTGATTRVYYAGTHSSGTNSGFFTSIDGMNWSSIGLPTSGFTGEWERIRVAIAPSNSDVVWFLAHGSSLAPSNTQLLKYVKSTTTWTDRTANLPSLGGDVGDFDTQSAYNMVLAIKPDNENYVFIGDTKLWRSSDGFASTANASNTGNTQWIGGYSPDNDISTYPNHHPDVHELVFLPGSNSEVISCHDGGVSQTGDITANNGVPTDYLTPHPVTWSLLNNGLYTTQTYTIAIDPSTENSSTILASFQDNGNFRTTELAETTTWTEEPYGGDGSWNAVVPGGNTWYISQQYGTIQRNSTSTANGPGVNPSSAGQSSTNTFISPFILDRNDSDIMYYAANENLWRNNSISTITGGNPFNGTSQGWSQLSGLALTGNITAMEVSVTPANVLYLGTSDGKVYKISNANSGSSVTPVNISTGLTSGYISSIDVDQDNADHVYVTFSNYGVVSIYRSTDAGQNWDNISGDLEENVDGSGSGPAVRWIHVFKNTDNSNIYFVGATTGLYATEVLNGTSTVWAQQATSTIGNVPVSMIRSRKIDGYLAVGTHGKGMFSTNIGDVSTGIDDLIFGVDNTDEMIVTPIDHGLNIQFLGEEVSSAEINIYDLNGNQATNTWNNSIRANKTNMKAQLKSGIYIMKATSPNRFYTQKFLIIE